MDGCGSTPYTVALHITSHPDDGSAFTARSLIKHLVDSVPPEQLSRNAWGPIRDMPSAWAAPAGCTLDRRGAKAAGHPGESHAISHRHNTPKHSGAVLPSPPLDLHAPLGGGDGVADSLATAAEPTARANQQQCGTR
mmetsp:Transcript_15883/g.47028  ORF Transcript_15883/g.47028 Transcript_15883/m.47028 type:complete len:137 (+) Transcript_15883:231-641(+)|eukprot:353203-Chlamydomonas_euryale.AAC.3